MNIQIYQIFYKEFQKDFLDSSFNPYSNEGKTYPFNFEYAVFFDLYQKTKWAPSDLLGTVSWKFHQKTGLAGTEFLTHINQNPGMDVYFVNPFPELCIYNSVWEHGDEFHKNLKMISKKLLRECGYDDSIIDLETPPRLTAYCNYWVANKVFWDEYIKFLEPFWSYVTNHETAMTSMLNDSADPFIKAPYLPFIFERLFSTFLTINNFKTSSLHINRSKLLENPYLRPIEKKIQNISQLDSHSQISLLDQIVVWSLTKARKLRHYSLPLLVRKFHKKP